MKYVIALLFAFSSYAFAGEHEHQPKVTANFEAMKALVGTWTGKTEMGGKPMDTTVVYELTSGGTALVEKLAPGTPHEMVTVYADNGKTINVTHYCAGGNQPMYTLKTAKDGTYDFEMKGVQGISSLKEEHMHGVKLTLKDGKLIQDWTNYSGGKKAGNTKFEFTKKI